MNRPCREYQGILLDEVITKGYYDNRNSVGSYAHEGLIGKHNSLLKEWFGDEKDFNHFARTCDNIF